MFYDPLGGGAHNCTTLSSSTGVSDETDMGYTDQDRGILTKDVVLQWALKYSPIVEELAKCGFHHMDIEKAVRLQFYKSGGMFSSTTQAINAITEMIYENQNNSNEKLPEITKLQSAVLKKMIRQKMCFSCKKRIATILIFPCQHISLCKICKPCHRSCPKCNEVAAEYWVSS